MLDRYVPSETAQARARVLFYHPEHEHAGMYPAILSSLRRSVEREILEKLAWRSAIGFIEQVWRRPQSCDI